jgi:hypothetical protein
MYFALASCLFLLVVTSGASLWNKFHADAFSSAYLAVSTFYLRVQKAHPNSPKCLKIEADFHAKPILFIILWLALKAHNNGWDGLWDFIKRPRWVDLNNEREVVKKFAALNRKRIWSFQTPT